MNPMRDIRVEKITLNVGVGEPGAKLDKAVKLLKNMTGEKPVKTTSTKRIPTWGARPDLPLACKVTLRKEKAKELLSRLLKAVGNKLPEKKFDKFGNFSFGIEEYILIPGVEYDVEVGIIGLEVAVTLERPGFRVKKKRSSSKIGIKHRITKEESIEFVKKTFGMVVS